MQQSVFVHDHVFDADKNLPAKAKICVATTVLATEVLSCAWKLPEDCALCNNLLWETLSQLILYRKGSRMNN
jgi:hypothetical protein